MGFNAVVVVLNDRLDEIERDPHFGKKLADAIRAHSWPQQHRPYITGQTQVISVEHADCMQVVAVGGNTGRIIGHGHRSDNDEELILHLNKERLRKQRRELATRPAEGGTGDA